MNQDEFSTMFDHLRQHYNTPVQCKAEFWGLFRKVQDANARRILEVGVERGGTIGFWDIIAGNEGRVVGLDTHINIPFEFQPNSEFTLLEGNSHAADVIQQVKEMLPEVDFLFIDGDHSYEGVKADWENFSPLVKPGGLIAFHDIVDEGVGPFWLEIEAAHKTERLHEQSGGIGIGVVYVPE